MANNTNELNINFMSPRELARWAVPATETETVLLAALKQMCDEQRTIEEAEGECVLAQDELKVANEQIAELEADKNELIVNVETLEANKAQLEIEITGLEKALAEALLKRETTHNPEDKEQSMTIEAILTEQNDLLRQILDRLAPPTEIKAEQAASKKSQEKPKASPATTTSGTPNSDPANSTDASTTSSAAAAETVSETTKVTYDDAKAAVTALVKAQGRDAGLAVLAKFKTDSLLNVPEADWPAVIEACEGALKEKALA